MANELDFTRISDIVGGIVDRKIRAVSISITGSSGYLRGLITQAQGYSADALTQANKARDSAVQSDTSAATSQMVFNNFTSTYLGINDSDPVRSSQGNAVNPTAFYIRRADGRLRYVTSIDQNGVPQYADATVLADTSSIAQAGATVFLLLNTTGLQNVRGPVSFQASTTGQRISSWTSQQLVTAIDVNDRVTTVQNSVTAERDRAVAAEASITGSRVAKTGDTMSGSLTIQSTGENVSQWFRNTEGAGRTYRISSATNGFLRFIDESAGQDRLLIASDGTVTVRGNFVANGNAFAATMFVNRSDNTDSQVHLQSNSVSRWSIGRSPTANRFYIARYNGAGAFIDTPIAINESDGAITTAKLTVSDTLTARGSIRVDGSGGTSVVVNNSTGNSATYIAFQNLGNTRWQMGRDAGGSVFFINRYNDSGGFIDTAFKINESDGRVIVNSLSVGGGGLAVAGTIQCSVLQAQANGTGQAILVGDDAWIGDINLANGFSIRGVQDFNAGWIQFGSNGAPLGCASGSSELRYGGNAILHTGNFNINAYSTYAANGNGRWEVRPNGVIEQWGVYSGSVSEGFYTVNLPRAFADVNSMCPTALIMNLSGDNRYDTWIQYQSHTTTTITFYVQYPGGGGNINFAQGFRWRVIGN